MTREDRRREHRELYKTYRTYRNDAETEDMGRGTGAIINLSSRVASPVSAQSSEKTERSEWSENRVTRQFAENHRQIA